MSQNSFNYQMNFIQNINIQMPQLKNTQNTQYLSESETQEVLFLLQEHKDIKRKQLNPAVDSKLLLEKSLYISEQLFRIIEQRRVIIKDNSRISENQSKLNHQQCFAILYQAAQISKLEDTLLNHEMRKSE